MRKKKQELTVQLRQTLLSLPDSVFIETIFEWIRLAEEYLQYPDWSDEYRYALGFRVQSLQTQTVYDTFSMLHENEPTTVNVAWVEPDVESVRRIMNNWRLEQFSRTIIPLVSDALFDRAVQEQWGLPPSSLRDGYEFLENLLHALSEGKEKEGSSKPTL